MSPNEAKTRKEQIDPALIAAGWNVKNPAQVAIELPVTGYDTEPWNGVTDYCLLRPNGDVIAVVEAKKQMRDPNVARAQVERYVKDIELRQDFRPFAFMTNGLATYFWDTQRDNPRLVADFFTPDDLERLLYLRQHGQPLADTLVNGDIAGRDYQIEAIRRISEAFEQGRRRALLVMATGTGKTRTTVALVDLFLRADQARRILFLADRDALVDQALNDGFKAFLPSEPRDRIFTHNIDGTKRLYVATLQTISRCYEQFSPAFFDLIVFDEAHRSIFNLFGEVMNYFDGRMIGLTATPANFIQRDTFNAFHCDHTTPTFLYTYEEAVAEKHLVGYALYQAKTGFQRDGVKGINLSEEERNALMEQGIDPDELDYSGTDLEKDVSVKGTLQAQWEEFMDVCIKDISGQLPGKTIIFAMTQKHAERLRLVFEEMYPQYKNLVQVITSDTERVRDGRYGDGLITKFKKNDFPRIAISVDMLDTGIDVPEVVNLVFMKPVQSQIKLWQMIGRGSRNHEACKHYDWLPNGHKAEFKIIDFWQNEFGKTKDDVEGATVPVLVTIFNARVKLLEAQLKHQHSAEAQQIKAELRTMVARIPTETFSVKKILPEIELAWTDSFWQHLSMSDIAFLRSKIGPLLRFAPGVDVGAETFTSKIERMKVRMLTTAPSPDALLAISEDVSRLPGFVRNDPNLKASIDLCLSEELARATPAQLTKVITDLAPQMRFRREKQNSFLALDLPDFIAASGYITLSDGAERVYVQEYKKRVEERVNKIVDEHPTIQAILHGEQITDLQLVALERTLRKELGGDAVELTTDNIRKAYGLKISSLSAFLRHLLELEAELLPDYETVVKRAFEEHLADHAYTADQIKFLRVVQSVFLQKAKLTEADLYEGSFAAFGQDAVNRFFTASQIAELLNFTKTLALAV